MAVATFSCHPTPRTLQTMVQYSTPPSSSKLSYHLQPKPNLAHSTLHQCTQGGATMLTSRRNGPPATIHTDANQQQHSAWRRHKQHSTMMNKSKEYAVSIFLRPGKTILAYYWTKHHYTAHHIEQHPNILTSQSVITALHASKECTPTPLLNYNFAAAMV